MTLSPKVKSQILGASIPGKRSVVMLYMTGFGAYRRQFETVRGAGYESFILGRGQVPFRSGF